MSDTTPKMSATINKDLGINNFAGVHYDRGEGYLVPIVGILRVKRVTADDDRGHEIQYIFHELEVAGKEHESTVRDMIGEIYRNRTAGQELPFPGTEDHAKYQLDNLRIAVKEWQDKENVGDLALGERWNAYFGDINRPHGPVGAAYAPLKEFALEIGAISSDDNVDTLFDGAPTEEPAEGESETRTDDAEPTGAELDSPTDPDTEATGNGTTLASGVEPDAPVIADVTTAQVGPAFSDDSSDPDRFADVDGAEAAATDELAKKRGRGK